VQQKQVPPPPLARRRNDNWAVGSGGL